MLTDDTPQANPTRKCQKCGEIKSLDEFPRDRTKSRGYSYVCKLCKVEKGRVYRESQRGREYRERWFAEHPEDRAKANARMEDWRSRNPDALAAHRAVWWAIHKQGILPKPGDCLCDHCGKVAQVYHHPNGYTDGHKYDVIPLCNRCHKLLHLGR